MNSVKNDTFEIVRKVEQFANSSFQIIKEFISSSTRPLAAVHTWLARGVATTLCISLKALAPSRYCEVVPAELFTYYISPYDEGYESDMIVFAAPGQESSLIRLLMSSRLTGHNLVLIASKLQQYIKHYLYGARVIEVEDPDLYWLLASMIVVRATHAYAKARGGVSRIKRLQKEVIDFSSIVPEVIDLYTNQLLEIEKSLKVSKRVVISYSYSMASPAEQLFYYLESINKQLIITELNSLPKVTRSSDSVIIMSTDVEDSLLKEIKFRLTRKKLGIQINELRLKTDPITAPIYGCILILAFKKLMSKKAEIER